MNITEKLALNRSDVPSLAAASVSYTDGILTPSIGTRVRHLANDSKIGVVTATCSRSYGTNYGVVWDDLTERWHALEELQIVTDETKKIGIPT